MRQCCHATVVDSLTSLYHIQNIHHKEKPRENRKRDRETLYFGKYNPVFLIEPMGLIIGSDLLYTDGHASITKR